MDLSLEIDLGGIFAIPDSFVDWLFTCIPTVLVIRMERLGLTMPRVTYLVSMSLRLVGFIIFGMAVVSLTTSTMSVFVSTNPDQYGLDDFVWPLTIVGAIVSALYAFVMTRPIIWRLRDAGLDPRFAYLLIVPVISTLMTIGLIFYPPSKNAEPVAAAG